MKSFLYTARPMVFDMAATLLFAALFALTRNVTLATVAAIAFGAGQVALETLRGKRVPGLQWASLGLVAVLGGATLFTGDPRFVMLKPTVIYLTVGAAMLQPGWMDRYLPPDAHQWLPRSLIVAGGYVWSGLMFLTAALNLAIAVWLGHKAWLTFIGVFPLASKLGLFVVNYLSFRAVALGRRKARAAAA